MVKSGLVITFDGPASEESFRGVLAARGAAFDLWCGAPIGSLLPVVVNSDTTRAGSELLREVERLPGVRRVDVVAIDFGSDEDAEEQA